MYNLTKRLEKKILLLKDSKKVILIGNEKFEQKLTPWLKDNNKLIILHIPIFNFNEIIKYISDIDIILISKEIVDKDSTIYNSFDEDIVYCISENNFFEVPNLSGHLVGKMAKLCKKEDEVLTLLEKNAFSELIENGYLREINKYVTVFNEIVTFSKSIEILFTTFLYNLRFVKYIDDRLASIQLSENYYYQVKNIYGIENKFAFVLFLLKYSGININCFIDNYLKKLNKIEIDSYSFEYFNKTLNVVANDGDIVLDCGGLYGHTAITFSNNVGSKGHVYSFEPIPNSYKHHKENTKEFDNITSLNYALGNENKYVYMCEEVGSSHINKNGTIKMEQITIDDFVKDHNLNKIDFIKMDIEGSEVSALLGAQETIQRFKPKLAISIYHKISDFHEIPKLIKSILPEYKICLNNNYSNFWQETDCFASI